MNTTNGARTVDLFWTGGWVSTFRLLSALQMEEVRVRPHYVLDPSSPRTELEIDAMQHVRRAVQSWRPELAERLLPTASTSLDDLAEDDVGAARFERLSARAGLGRHYEWVSRYARHAGLDELEVGSHRGDPAVALLGDELRRVREQPFATYRLAPEAKDSDLGIFSRLTFPLADLTRGDMRRIALERGFLDTLDLTWFCTSPRRGAPCGVCDKCHAAVVDGFGHMLPAHSLRLHDIKWLTRWRPWQNVVERVMG